MRDLYTLPDNLPVPVDDGACRHLEGMKFPSVDLESTSGLSIDISTESGILAIYFYPMMGRPDSPPLSDWNDIPGARGCTPQSCGFRDHHLELIDLGARVYGISSQTIEDQKEAAERLHLPFDLLSDSDFEMTRALNLPTFEYSSQKLIKRLTLIIERGIISKVFYPVFPPNQNAVEVVLWLEENRI